MKKVGELFFTSCANFMQLSIYMFKITIRHMKFVREVEELNDQCMREETVNYDSNEMVSNLLERLKNKFTRSNKRLTSPFRDGKQKYWEGNKCKCTFEEVYYERT